MGFLSKILVVLSFSVAAFAHTDLSINLSSDAVHPHHGDLVTYTVTVANIGDQAVTNLETVTVLPEGLDYVFAETVERFHPTSASVTWGLESLLPGETVEYTYQAYVIATTGTLLNLEATVHSYVGGTDVNAFDNVSRLTTLVLGSH